MQHTSNAVSKGEQRTKRLSNSVGVTVGVSAVRGALLALGLIGGLVVGPRAAEAASLPARQALLECIELGSGWSPASKAGHLDLGKQPWPDRSSSVVALLASVTPDRLPVSDQQAQQKRERRDHYWVLFEQFYHDHPLGFQAILLVLGWLIGCRFQLDVMAEIYRTPRDWLRWLKAVCSELRH